MKSLHRIYASRGVIYSVAFNLIAGIGMGSAVLSFLLILDRSSFMGLFAIAAAVVACIIYGIVKGHSNRETAGVVASAAVVNVSILIIFYLIR